MSPEEYQTRLAQTYLTGLGYYHGRLDGRWGPISEAASKKWFLDLHKSKICNPFIGSLRALAAQMELRERGLYLRALDGEWGPHSKSAAFEAQTSEESIKPPAQLAPDNRHHTLPYDVAKNHLGVREIPGKNHNPLILRWLRAVLSWVSSDETAWCSAFVNFCAREAGYESSGSLAARSWLEVGEFVPLSEARKGDVVILWRVKRDGWQGHVAFLDHYNPKRGLLYLLGGNQSDAVNITAYSDDYFLGVRRLRTLDQLQGTVRNV